MNLATIGYWGYFRVQNFDVLHTAVCVFRWPAPRPAEMYGGQNVWRILVGTGSRHELLFRTARSFECFTCLAATILGEYFYFFVSVGGGVFSISFSVINPFPPCSCFSSVLIIVEAPYFCFYSVWLIVPVFH